MSWIVNNNQQNKMFIYVYMILLIWWLVLMHPQAFWKIQMQIQNENNEKRN
jgi:hypothetical protein